MTSHGNSINRRNFLKATGAGAVVGTAGCLGFLDDDDEMSFVLGTAASGSSTHAAGSAMLFAIDQHSDELSVTLQQSDGWVANTYLYDGGEIPSMGCDNNTLAHAINHEDPFDDDPVSRIPGQGFHFTALHIYLMGVEGSDLESSDDITEDHTIYPIQPGFGTRLLTMEVYERAGLDRANYINVDVGDIPGEIEEGNVDALAVYGSDHVALAGWVAEVDVRNEVYALAVGADLEQAIEETPGARVERFEPYGWEQDVSQATDEVTSWVLDGQWMFGPEVSAEAAYEFARISHEHTETIQESDPTYPDHSDPSEMTLSVMDELPVHEGIAEFYQDHGVWDDSWDIGNEFEP